MNEEDTNRNVLSENKYLKQQERSFHLLLLLKQVVVLIFIAK